MANFTTLLIPSLLLIYTFLRTLHSILRKYRASQNGCVEPRHYPHKDPIFGIDLFLKYMDAFKSGCYLSFNKDMFDEYGKTFRANVFGTTTYRTIDPNVSKAVHSTYAAKFGLEPLRYEVAKHLWGNGIIVVDGEHWKHGRALMKPSFDVVHIANLDRLRKHVDAFMKLLPKDGTTVNLMPLFKRLVGL